MSSSSSKELCNKLEPYLQKKTTRMRASTSVETQIALFLYYISNYGQYRKIANSFGIFRASASLIIRRLSYSIVKYLSSDYMKVPKSPEEVEHSTSLIIDTHGFPQCLGSINGTHTEVIELQHHYTDYINRTGYTSINAQAVCDYKYCFMDVVVKWPRSVHDARIFQNSSLHNMLKDGTVSLCAKRIVPNRDPAPVFLVGRSSIPSSSICDERVFRE